MAAMKHEAHDADVKSADWLWNNPTRLQSPPLAARSAGQHRPPSGSLSDPQLAQSRQSQPGGVEYGACGATPPVISPPAMEPTSASRTSALGPMSARPLLPARKKPGRKPIPEQEVGDRRRKQNRESQRNFRQRKQDKFSEALNDKLTLQKVLEERELDFQRALEAQKRQLREAMEVEKQQFHEAMELEKLQIRETFEAKRRHYEAGNNELRKRAETAERRAADLDAKLACISPYSSSSPTDNVVQLASCGPHVRTTGSSGGVADITPTEEYEETDFTATWSRKTVPITNSHPNYELDEQTAGFGLCGFCTDFGNCQCRTNDPGPEIEASGVAGNCNSCLQNPSRQACCRQIANTARNVSENTLAPMMMSCSRFFDKAEARTQTFPSISQLFGPGNPLKAYTSGNAGFQVSEQEAAAALQTLSSASK